MTLKSNNIKLGLFVMAGLALTMTVLYFIAKNKNSFGSGLAVKVRFSNLNGLVEGNNVLYAGMPAGNVQQIAILNDTTIEVKLLINEKITPFIHQNAIAAIGSEGLMGNKVVNITPSGGKAAPIREGDLLMGRQNAGIDQMLPKMSRISDNVEVTSQSLKNLVVGLDTGSVVKVLKDQNTAAYLKNAIVKISLTAENAHEISAGLNGLLRNARQGKGSIGKILSDTSMAYKLEQSIDNIYQTSRNARISSETLNVAVIDFKAKMTSGKGPVSLLLDDTAAANSLKATIINIRNGTDGFNQNMEALKHNFLLRGYFKRLEKEKAERLKTGKKQ